MTRTHDGAVVGFCLGEVYIETVMTRRELAELIKYLIGVGRKLKLMNRTWTETIMSISIENIMNSPECFHETTFGWETCKWYWGTRGFFERELG